ncbi:MAG: GGDEF domain-containing protein [Burkholderiales bacterium]|nr:GGDEF domain-containing protein [Burkholderiales bacterium]
MKRLVDGLVRMSRLRDRDALDQALVQLVGEHADEGVETAQLMRLVGESQDMRCLTLATNGLAVPATVQNPVWEDWTLLPHLVDDALRLQAVTDNTPALSNALPWRVVFPIEQTLGEVGVLLDVAADRPFSAELLDVLGSAVQNYRNLLGLLDYGEKDALTELLNRKSFDGAFFKAAQARHAQPELLQPERRAAAEAPGTWLAVLDIDHFKRVNDNFGHLIGDEVLLLMARLMRANFRFHDQLYRFGGEEFVILMRCPSAEDALGALERLRHRVANHVFPQVGQITVSIGFACLRGNDTPGAAFGRADQAVYYAKEHGRNQCCSYDKLVQTGALEQAKAEAMDVDLF